MSAYFDRPPFQIGAQRASTSSSSSFSSSSSYGFDRRSKVSQLTDLTPLITPVDSLDSIFGINPDLQPVPHFPDLLAWDGLTDEQWKLHSLLYKAERAIQGAAKGILSDFEDFLQDEILYDDDDLYGPDDEFDAVAAVRARLAKGEQTTMTQRALDIMDSRSGVASTSIDDTNSGGVEHPIAEEIDDCADTFKVGGDDVLDIPATPHNGSFLEAIEEVDESREPDSLFNVTFPSPFLFESDIVVPPTPLIRPVDAVGNRLSFPIYETSTSTPKLISRLMISPLLLNDPDITSSPAIFRNSFRNIDPSSPIVAISSVLFSSRLPLPTSLLNESLDDVAARLRISDIDDVNPRASVEFSQDGLGLVGVPTGKEYEFQTSHLDRPNATKVMTPGAVGSTSESSSEVDLPHSRDSGPRCSESVSAFELARSPWDILLEDLGQGVTPYAPTLDYTIAYTGPGTNIGFDGGITVVAGSSHPAASASFITSTNEASEAGKGAKGLGLGLPMGVEQRVSRCCTSGLPSSEACLDLASLAARLMETDSDSLGDFRGHVLSPIAEELSAQPDEPCPTFSEPPVPSPPSPKKRRNFFKRILRFVLPTFSIRRRH